MFTRLWKEEDGQGMTEYGLVLGLIAVAVVSILVVMRDDITALFTKASTAIKEGIGGTP